MSKPTVAKPGTINPDHIANKYSFTPPLFIKIRDVAVLLKVNGTSQTFKDSKMTNFRPPIGYFVSVPLALRHLLGMDSLH